MPPYWNTFSDSEREAIRARLCSINTAIMRAQQGHDRSGHRRLLQERRKLERALSSNNRRLSAVA
jgi:hypothetical protein